jgi:hypothetical protein
MSMPGVALIGPDTAAAPGGASSPTGTGTGIDCGVNAVSNTPTDR